MARKSRKNMPEAAAQASDNLTAEAVLNLDRQEKPYQAAIYARLSFESEANRERDTVETQIAYIRHFISEQPDMVEAGVYADISVTGTTFERLEFDRMMQDIRAGKINTVITRDLSRLGRNYVETGNYIERVFPFLDVRYIAITDDFDSARPGTDLSVPLKNIVNEFYSKDLSKKVTTGKRAIWLRGEFCDFLVPYGYRKVNKHLVVNEETKENVINIFNWFMEGKGYNEIAKMLEAQGHLSPQKCRFLEVGNQKEADKAGGWSAWTVKKILGTEYYIGNSVHGKQRRALETGRKTVNTSPDTWVRIENTHEPIIEKDLFYRAQQELERRTDENRKKHSRNPKLPNPPVNKFRKKIHCAECGGALALKRWNRGDKFCYICLKHRKRKKECANNMHIPLEAVESTVYSVIRQHINLCIDKHQLIRRLNGRSSNVRQHSLYEKEILRLYAELRKTVSKKNGLYEDYREKLITPEELCSYREEYENTENEIKKRIEVLEDRKQIYAKDFHINKDWEQAVSHYLRKRTLTQEMVDAFVEDVIVYDDTKIEVRLKYDDDMTELLETAKKLEVQDGE